MREIPDRAMNDAPPGTPPGLRADIAPVWCTHGVRWMWVAGKAAYVADDALEKNHLGHEVPAETPGVIPCSPVTAYDPADPMGEKR